MRRHALLLFLLFLTPVAASFAADVGLIALRTEKDLQNARTIFGHALGLVGDQFLVEASAQQLDRLAAAGILFEPLVSGVPLNRLHLIYPREGSDTKRILDGIAATTLSLDNSLILAEMSVTSAQAAAELDGLKANCLAELESRFFLHRSSSAISLAASSPPYTDSMALRVNEDSVFSYVNRLQAFYTRYLRTDSMRKAADWLLAKYDSLGFDSVYAQPFQYLGPQVNIVAVKLGTVEPEKLIVLGGHYDSYCVNDPNIHAPGADDDASGTAVTLELARIFANVPTRKTIVFVAFGAEELGMYGSGHMARSYAAADAEIEVMFNFDMVSYAWSGEPLINIHGAVGCPYRSLTFEAAERLTDLVPNYQPKNLAADQAPFDNQGYRTVFAIEPNPRSNPHYHQDHDSTAYISSVMLADIARMGAAAIAYVADAPSPQTIEKIVDAGNGNEVEVFIDHCEINANYVLAIGDAPGSFVSLDTLPPGTCSRVVTGLDEGTTYYFSVRTAFANGLTSLFAEEVPAMSLTIPRMPAKTMATPDTDAVYLDWSDNAEADLHHYTIFRKAESDADFGVLVTNLTSSAWADESAESGTIYQYRIGAVDNDGNVSALSAPISCAIASFAKPILIVDETSMENEYLPNQTQQLACWDSIFQGLPHDHFAADTLGQNLPDYMAGQYRSIYWLDEDISSKLLSRSGPGLQWYLGHTHTNMLLAGLGTILGFGGLSIDPEGMLYQQFHLESFVYHTQPDFVGANPASGWPILKFDKTRGMPSIGEIPTLVPRSGAQVIYRYDGKLNFPGREGTPIGIAYQGPEGKRILLGFPLYYLSPSSAHALVLAAHSYFEGMSAANGGDADGSGVVDVGDLGQVVDYLYFKQPVVNIEGADVDGVCGVDVTDLMVMIEYLFFGNNMLLPPNCTP